MTYTLIGTGNMAWFLTQRLTNAGFLCQGIYGKNPLHAEKLANSINAPVLKTIQEINDEADCCILAVSDQAIPEIAAQLSLTKTPIIHTAGAVSLDILKGNHCGVVWFVYSIVKEDLPLHRNIPAIIESSTQKASLIAQQIASSVSDMVQEVTWEQRQWLHLSAVFGNNFTNHLMAICEQICKEQGLSFSLLLPILSQTLERLKNQSPLEIQTGPAKRGDMITLERHQKMLINHPQWKAVYKAISNSIEATYSEDTP